MRATRTPWFHRSLVVSSLGVAVGVWLNAAGVVARAKDLFDAAIRRVDPPRPGAAPTAAQAPAASPLPAVEGEAAEREAADADDEHRNDSEER
jgi:ribosomal protein L12E/L44/L45/RPP1/RPP2